MKLKAFLSLFFLLISAILLADDTTAVATASESAGSNINWFNLILGAGYLIGVFILLPIVIYTNQKSKLYKASENGQEDFQTLRDLDEEKRNERASEILIAIEEKLTAFTNDEGQDMITITKGKQAKFMKNGLDYINKNLRPTDPELIERINDFTDMYKIRTKRIFTGSKWIIAAAIGVGVLMVSAGGITSFIFIHALGIIFYILSSRTPMYALEKRRHKFGQLGTGMIGGIMTALALGDGTKYYVSTNGGPYQRDWETEGQMAITGIIILIFIALILGLAAAFLGVINFIFNYSHSFVLPFNKTVDWYEEKFKMQNA